METEITFKVHLEMQTTGIAKSILEKENKTFEGLTLNYLISRIFKKTSLVETV